MILSARQETLAKVEAQSAEEYERLLKDYAEGEIFYSPRIADLFIFQLDVSDRTDMRGHHHNYTQLFATREAALLGAAVNIKRRYLDRSWGSLNDDLQSMYDEGKYEELMEYVSTRLMFFQKISMVRVQA